jgi:vacuolar-type H+-ATPase subunit H
MKQTSIEWVLQYLNNVKPSEFCSIEKIKELLNQAKEMHKQEIEDAYNKCYEDLSNTQKEVDKLSTYASQLPQQEISDEEIQKEAKNHHNYYEWSAGAKWYREQLKQRQCNKQQ